MHETETGGHRRSSSLLPCVAECVRVHPFSNSGQPRLGEANGSCTRVLDVGWGGDGRMDSVAECQLEDRREAKAQCTGTEPNPKPHGAAAAPRDTATLTAALAAAQRRYDAGDLVGFEIYRAEAERLAALGGVTLGENGGKNELGWS